MQSEIVTQVIYVCVCVLWLKNVIKAKIPHFMFIYTIIQLKASQSLSPMLFTTHRPSRAHACMHARTQLRT